MRRLHLVLALAAVAAPVALHAQAGAHSPIDSLALRAHTFFLASDLLEGRGTGRRGHDIAAAYVAGEARRLGLTGPGPGGAYLQPVPLIDAAIDPRTTTMTVRTTVPPGSRHLSLAYGADFIPNVGTTRTLVDFSGPVVWAGTPHQVLAAPDRLPDLGGRVVILAGVFGNDGAAADTLRRRGAVGVVHLLTDDEMFRLYVDSRGPTRMSLDDPAAASSFIPDIPAVIAAPSVTGLLVPRILAAGGGEDRPAALPDLTIDVTIRTTPHHLHSPNVAAVLPGTDPARRHRYIVYTAHLDHLGISTPDALGDSIYNGFSDNAAGSAMLLAIAQALAAGPRPAHSVLFLWFTGEERGLLGSDWFVAHPLVPPDSILGVVNLDAGAPPGAPVVWHVAGGTRSELGALALRVASAAGWSAEVRPPRPNSDYFPFLRIGVPAIFLVPGPAAYEGLTDAQSQALRGRWDHYHQAADAWAPDFPFSGLVRYADFALRIGRAMDTSPRPRLIGTPAP